MNKHDSLMFILSELQTNVTKEERAVVSRGVRIPVSQLKVQPHEWVSILGSMGLNGNVNYIHFLLLEHLMTLKSYERIHRIVRLLFDFISEFDTKEQVTHRQKAYKAFTIGKDEEGYKRILSDATKYLEKAPMVEGESKKRKIQCIIGEHIEKEDLNKTCIVCKENKIAVITVPCVHAALCKECAQERKQMENPTCPVCEQAIEYLVRIFY